MLDFGDVSLGNGVLLTARRPKHTAGIFAAVDRSRDHLRPWFPWVDMTRTVNDVARRYEATAAQRIRGELMEFVIIEGATVIGKVDLHAIQQSEGMALLGYWLSAEAEGRGLMRAAIASVTGFAYRKLGLRRLELRTAVNNHRSRALVEGLGFQLKAALDLESRGDMGEETVQYFRVADENSEARAVHLS